MTNTHESLNNIGKPEYKSTFVGIQPSSNKDFDIALEKRIADDYEAMYGETGLPYFKDVADKHWRKINPPG